MNDVRARTICVAESYTDNGVNARSECYFELIAAGESAQARRDMARMSGCALVVRGLWRLLGLRDARLEAPYSPGKAVAWLVEIARDRGAWVDSSVLKLPAPGDVVLVGGGLNDGGMEHVFTVLETMRDEFGPAMRSLDGGQVDKHGGQIIRQKWRTWALRAGWWFDRSGTGNDPGADRVRRVKGWVDLDRLMVG